MWPFKKKLDIKESIKASSVEMIDGIVTIDVQGQTCPGYLLAINKEVDKLENGTDIELLISYAPCFEDVKVWCKERDIAFKNINDLGGMWKISIKK